MLVARQSVHMTKDFKLIEDDHIRTVSRPAIRMFNVSSLKIVRSARHAKCISDRRRK